MIILTIGFMLIFTSLVAMWEDRMGISTFYLIIGAIMVIYSFYNVL